MYFTVLRLPPRRILRRLLLKYFYLHENISIHLHIKGLAPATILSL